MNEAAIHSMLENWARWARGRAVQGHCASIEYRYRSKLRPDMTPTGWGDWIPVVPLPILPPIDALQALEVERCMRHLPDGHRMALRLVYVDRMPRKMACLYLVIAFRDYERYLGDARCMIANLLQRAKEKRIIPRQSAAAAQAGGAQPPEG
ncbi:MAG: hypothetical protein NUV75_02220 [Gallionella sp.]|nr:hypothetical protein [Gallionella sp.]